VTVPTHTGEEVIPTMILTREPRSAAHRRVLPRLGVGPANAR